MSQPTLIKQLLSEGAPLITKADDLDSLTSPGFAFSSPESIAIASKPFDVFHHSWVVDWECRPVCRIGGCRWIARTIGTRRQVDLGVRL